MNFCEAIVALVAGKKVTNTKHETFKDYYWVIENGQINEYRKGDNSSSGRLCAGSLEYVFKNNIDWVEYIETPKVYYKDLKPGQKFIYPDSERSPVKMKIDIERKHIRLDDGVVYDVFGDINTKEVILVS